MYFDDANIVDWASAKGNSQMAFVQLNQLLGTPFAEEKHQPMACQGLFLGLDHDFRDIPTSGQVSFWPRQRLIDKVTDMIQESKLGQVLRPGTASKIYGMMNFLEQGTFGRIGAQGLSPIKERQYERERHLTPQILSSFDVILTILRDKPRRRFEIFPKPCLRFVGASDAALEQPKEGTGGFCIVWFSPQSETREAFIADLPREVYDLWEPGDRKIAQLEMVMILQALVCRPQYFRERRGVWFIDNVAVLMTLIRGRSDSPDLAIMSGIIHAFLFAYRTWIFWEWVPSKSNWTDSISRLGWNDPWFRNNLFSAQTAPFPFFLWNLPLMATIRVAEYL